MTNTVSASTNADMLLLLGAAQPTEATSGQEAVGFVGFLDTAQTKAQGQMTEGEGDAAGPNAFTAESDAELPAPKASDENCAQITLNTQIVAAQAFQPNTQTSAQVQGTKASLNESVVDMDEEPTTDVAGSRANVAQPTLRSTMQNEAPMEGSQAVFAGRPENAATVEEPQAVVASEAEISNREMPVQDDKQTHSSEQPAKMNTSDANNPEAAAKALEHVVSTEQGSNSADSAAVESGRVPQDTKRTSRAERSTARQLEAADGMPSAFGRADAPADSLLALSELAANAVRAKESVGIAAEGKTHAQAAVWEISSEVKQNPEMPEAKSIGEPVVNLQVQNDSFVKSVQSADKAENVHETVVSRRIIDQVVREATLSRNLDRSDFVVKLTPPSMGTIRLQITQDGAGISTRIVASSEQVKDLLNRHMPTLISSMNEAGIKVDSLNVTTENRFESGTFSHFGSFRDAQNQPNHPRDNRRTNRHHFGVIPNAATMTKSRSAASTAYSWVA